MAHRRTRAGALAAASLLVAAPLALAQSASAPASSAQARTDQYIAGLQAQLRITPAEQGAWDAFASVMRQNAAEIDAKLADRQQHFATMNAVDDLKSYADVASLHAQETARMVAPFATLYAQLSPAQKSEADTLFHKPPPGPHHGPTRP